MTGSNAVFSDAVDPSQEGYRLPAMLFTEEFRRNNSRETALF